MVDIEDNLDKDKVLSLIIILMLDYGINIKEIEQFIKKKHFTA